MHNCAFPQHPNRSFRCPQGAGPNLQSHYPVSHLEHRASSQSVTQKPLMKRPATTLRAACSLTGSMATGAPRMTACSTMPSAQVNKLGFCI